MKTGVEKIIQAKGGDAPAKNQTGVQKIIELLGGGPPAKNQTGVDKIVEILENGGGGGDPNRVQTITGTLAEPFGDVDPYELVSAISSNEATAIIAVDGTDIGAPVITEYLKLLDLTHFGFTYLLPTDGGYIAAISVWGYADSFTLTNAITLVLTDGDPATYTENFIADYASLIPTTLTIIWHPLPEQS